MADANMPGGPLTRLRGHLANHRARRHLQSLEPHLLRDIGLNPDSFRGTDLHAEAARRLLGAR
jgi:uncharacterized protein YjiS (DUF1127 family)